MSIFKSKKMIKFKEMAWNYQSIVEVALGDFEMISERVTSGSMSKESAYDYLMSTGSWLCEKNEEFKKEYIND